MASAFGAGSGADMLQSILRDRIGEALRRQALAQEQQRIGLEQQRMTELAVERQAAMADLSQQRERAATAQIMKMTPRGTDLTPEMAGRARAAGFNVEHQQADLPSLAISGIAQAGAKAPSMGPLKMVAAGRPERDTFAGTDEQIARDEAIEEARRVRADAAQAKLDAATREENFKREMATQAQTGREDLARLTAGLKHSGGAGSMTPYQTATTTRNLRNDYSKIVAPSRAMRQQLNYMEQGIEAAKKGDLNSGSQAVLVTFQKILDPNSVVRESEYARSAAGLGLMQRIEGIIPRLTKGGPGVPLAELQKFADLARQFTSNAEESATRNSAALLQDADDMGIDRRRIVGEERQTSSGGGVSAPKRTRYDLSGNVIPDKR